MELEITIDVDNLDRAIEFYCGGLGLTLVERDPDVARKCMREDQIVNKMEVDIDELCVSILALRQPAAEDLRMLISGLKISTDLERIGDLAVNM